MTNSQPPVPEDEVSSAPPAPQQSASPSADPAQPSANAQNATAKPVSAQPRYLPPVYSAPLTSSTAQPTYQPPVSSPSLYQPQPHYQQPHYQPPQYPQQGQPTYPQPQFAPSYATTPPAHPPAHPLPLQVPPAQVPPVHGQSRPLGQPTKKGLAITALVLGVVAILFLFVPIFGALVGLVGVALGVIAIAKRQPKGLALTGTIISAVAVFVGIIISLLAGAFIASVLSGVDNPGRSGSEGRTFGGDTNSESSGPTTGRGSSDDPYAIGDVISSEDWDIVVNDINLDANDVIANEDWLNEAPPAGKQYAIVSITAIYTGSDTGYSNLIDVEYLERDGSIVNQWDNFVVAPKPDLASSELDENGKVTGNVALLISSEMDGQLRITPDFMSDPVFVATK